MVPHSELSWFITPITRTYGKYVELVNGIINQLITGWAPSCSEVSIYRIYDHQAIMVNHRALLACRSSCTSGGIGAPKRWINLPSGFLKNQGERLSPPDLVAFQNGFHFFQLKIVRIVGGSVGCTPFRMVFNGSC